MPRKRTFEDRKFSVNDANSQAYRDNWDKVFGNTGRSSPSEPSGADEVTISGGSTEQAPAE